MMVAWTGVVVVESLAVVRSCILFDVARAGESIWGETED